MNVSDAKRWLVIAILVGAVSLVAAANLSAETILTHRYTFDTDFSDSVGTFNASDNGTDAHVDTIVSSPVGPGVLALDGYNDRAVIPEPEVLPAGPFTISWWAYLDEEQYSTKSSYYIATPVSGLISKFNLRAHPGDRLDGRITINFGNGPVPVQGAWSHHVVTWTTEGQGLWYRNGVLVNDTTGDANGPKPFAGLPTPAGTEGALAFGDIYDSAAYDLHGYMDDVQIYTGTCTQGDAQYLYDNPGAVIPEPSVLALLLAGALGLAFPRRP